MSMLSTMLGAFFGALFGYWFALYQQKQEWHARRGMLLNLLREELNFIGRKLPSYDVGKAIYRDPIRLCAPSRLRDGQGLTFLGDG